MQDLPDAPAILGELARFLDGAVRPTIADRGLAFRVRIATHLLGVLAREAALAENHLAREADRLAALLDVDAPATDRGAWVLAQNAALAEGLRAGRFDADRLDAIRGHLLATLRDTLAVVQPDFDTRVALD